MALFCEPERRCEDMKKLFRILLAGLVSLAFLGEALAQAPTPPPAPAHRGPAVSSEKHARAHGKRRSKHMRRHHRGKRSARAAAPVKHQ